VNSVAIQISLIKFTGGVAEYLKREEEGYRFPEEEEEYRLPQEEEYRFPPEVVVLR